VRSAYTKFILISKMLTLMLTRVNLVVKIPKGIHPVFNGGLSGAYYFTQLSTVPNALAIMV
jgi:hypothetical protein